MAEVFGTSLRDDINSKKEKKKQVYLKVPKTKFYDFKLTQLIEIIRKLFMYLKRVVHTTSNSILQLNFGIQKNNRGMKNYRP